MSPKISQLRSVAVECNEDAVQHLKDLLADAEAGEVLTVSGIAELRDGTYRQFGSTTMSRLQTAGCLLELAVRRVQE